MTTSRASIISTLVIALAVAIPFSLAHADATVSIENISPGATVPIGTQATFNIVGTGFNAALSYAVSDSLTGSTVSASNINSAGVFSWIPASADAGTHTITITTTDGTGNSVISVAQFTVPTPPGVSIQNLSPGATVLPQHTVFFTAIATGFTSPIFSVSDSATASSLNSSALNAAGGFSWTPKVQDVGAHTLTVTVTDSSGHSASATQAITVSAPGSITISPALTSTTTIANTPITFTVSSAGITSPIYSVSDALFGSSVSNSAINSGTGIFNWTPKGNELGTHNLTFSATDASGNSASATIFVIVKEPPVTPSITAAVIVPTSSVVPVSTTTPSASSAALTSLFISSLSVGSSGPEVTALQTLLARLGFFSSAPSGTFGPLTKAAVMSFQKARGLEQVGNVGPGTRAALNQASTVSSPAPVVATPSPASTSTPAVASSGFRFTLALTIGSRGAEVTELQKRLITLGLLSGDATGYYGQLTFAAVKAFQTSKGLESVGNVGPGTRAALNAGI